MPGDKFVRLLVRMMIPELYETYKSANKALEFLRSVGLGYRRKDFLADWREVLEIPKKTDVWKYIRNEFKIPEAEHVLSTWYTMSNFTYMVEATFQTLEGVLNRRVVTVMSDSVLSKNEIFDRVLPQLDTYRVEEVLGSLVGLELKAAYKAVF